MSQAPESLLVVLLGSIGDLARGLCILPPLRRTFPKLRITWVVERPCDEILSALAEIDEVIVFERSRGWAGVKDLFSELRSRKFDLCFDMQRIVKSGLIARLSGAKKRIGFHRQNSKEGNWLFQNESIPPRSKDFPKINQYMDFPLAIGAESEADIEFPHLDLSSVRELIEPVRGQNRRVAFVLSSSWPSKDWTAQGYSQLSVLLAQRYPGLEIVLCGTSSDEALASQLQSQQKENVTYFHLAGKSTLLELMKVFQNCDLILGPDSGPGHLAALLRRPYCTLFGPTEIERVAPFRMEHLALRSQIGCAPCLRRKCPGLDRMCMRLISAQEVFEKVLPILDAVDSAVEMKEMPSGIAETSGIE